MSNPFVKAVKHQLKARVAFAGPTGSGKTYSALEWARILAGPDGTIAVVDTEHGSASLYADQFTFDVLPWAPPYDPGKLADTITAAETAGYDVIVLDSMSHFWEGEGGTLDIADAAGQRSGGNSFAGWKVATPALRHLIDTMLGCNMHVIGTMRSKMEYVLEEDSRGKKVPKRVGMAPVMRNGVEYEFTMVGDIDLEHRILFTKSRCSALADVMVQPGRAGDAAKTFVDWLESGEAAPARVVMASDADLAEIADWAKRLDADQKAELGAWRDAEGLVVKTGQITAADSDRVLAKIRDLISNAPAPVPHQDSPPDGAGVADALVGDPQHAPNGGDDTEGSRPNDVPSPPDGPPITDPQLKALNTALHANGVAGPARLVKLTEMLDRPIGSTKDLTKAEATWAIDALGFDKTGDAA
jgi:DNA polymerase III delta prime subunit